MNKSHYDKKHKNLARKLRKDGAKGEAMLWDDVLKAKKFHGFQFNRQFCIDDYIVDFISRRLKLIIEVDGTLTDSNMKRIHCGMNDYKS